MHPFLVRLIDGHYRLVIFPIAVLHRIIKFINGCAVPRSIDTWWHLGWRRVLNWSRDGNTMLLLYQKCCLFQYADATRWAKILCRMLHAAHYTIIRYIIRLRPYIHATTNIVPLSCISTGTYKSIQLKSLYVVCLRNHTNTRKSYLYDKTSPSYSQAEAPTAYRWPAFCLPAAGGNFFNWRLQLWREKTSIKVNWDKTFFLLKGL